MAIAKAGKVETAAIRDAQGADLRQGAARHGEDARLDNQIVVPSYLMRVREGWTKRQRHVRGAGGGAVRGAEGRPLRPPL
jgi:hypothetical protein